MDRHPQQAGAEDTIMTKGTQKSGHLQSMYSQVCGIYLYSTGLVVFVYVLFLGGG
jgi:hypothetical protein